MNPLNFGLPDYHVQNFCYSTHIHSGQMKSAHRNLNFFPGHAAQLAAILALGALIGWLCAFHPAALPFWMPWDFSWPEYLAFSLTLLWFFRGLMRAPPRARPPLWRRIAFFAGLALLYGAMQTHFDYMAQHMFFLNRIQHVVMHHIGPFLAALGCSGETIRRGMPQRLRRAVESRFVTVFMNIVQQPFVAAFLFVGLFYFWLIPPVHFRAMIDPNLYAVMNWSMVIDGLFFWCLVLDPRPMPPARVSFAARLVLDAAVMFSQIILGALIAFASRDLYPFYNLCGRLYPSIGALADQHIGGIVIWIPPAMMSAIGGLVILNFYRLQEERNGEKNHEAPRISSASR
jgi:putative membrane protein